MNKAIVLLGAAAAAFSVGCSGGKAAYDGSGAFESTEVTVSSELTGRILEFPVQEGDAVAAGKPLGLIDTAQLQLKKDQLQATLNSVESRRPDIALQIASLEQQLATARTEQRRAENLVRADAANAKLLDDAAAQAALLEKQLAAQRSSLSRNDRGITEDASSLRLQIAELDDQIAKGTLASPIDGILLVKYAEAGELATVGWNLFKVADMENMRLRAYVAASQLTALRLGQKVKVRADFGTDGHREYEGVLSWISEKAEFTPKTVQTKDERADLVYAVKIAVRNDGYLKIGMYGDFAAGE